MGKSPLSEAIFLIDKETPLLDFCNYFPRGVTQMKHIGKAQLTALIDMLLLYERDAL